MGHGFPTAKFFRIINADTEKCLAAAHGGTTHGAQKAHDRLTGEEGFIPYSHTNDQVLTVRKPKGDRAEVWFFCELESHGEAWWHLVNANKDNRSTFALHVGALGGVSQPVGLGLYGWGNPGQTQWTAREGMFWPGPHENKVATLLPSGNGGHWAVVAERGSAPNQTWRFEETDLPGEAVPTYKKGIYATREGRDPAKVRGLLATKPSALRSALSGGRPGHGGGAVSARRT